MNPKSDFGFDKSWKRHIQLKKIYLCILIIIIFIFNLFDKN